MPPLDLPADRPRPAVATTAGAVLWFSVPAGVARRLRDLAAGSDATLFMVLAAACQVLARRWSGQDDIAVGTVTSGRDRPETQGLVGMFVNTLVLRSDVPGDRPFRDFLADVRETVLAAFARQDIPFEKVLEAVRPDRDTSRSPLFQVMVALHNLGGGDLDLPGLTAEAIAPPAVRANFDLSLDFTEHDGGLTGAVDYNTDLFDRSTAQRVADHLRPAAGRDRRRARHPPR